MEIESATNASRQLSTGGRVNGFRQARIFDIAKRLNPSVNVLSATARNAGDKANPAGLIGIVVVEFDRAERRIVPTDKQYLYGQLVGELSFKSATLLRNMFRKPLITYGPTFGGKTSAQNRTRQIRHRKDQKTM